MKEKRHQRKLTEQFSISLYDKRVVWLGIKDDYDFTQPELVELLRRTVMPYLASMGVQPRWLRMRPK